jgi:hypothetical protein
MLITLTPQTILQSLESLTSVGNVASYSSVGIWPQPWIDPNDLAASHPGISPVPGSYVVYNGPSGQALYQNPIGHMQAGDMFLGQTFEAQFPTVAQFIAAGLTSEDANTAYDQLYEGNFWNDMGGGTIWGASFNGVLAPGDLGLYGLSSAAQLIVYNVMWAAYKAGGVPSWSFIGNIVDYRGPSVYPAMKVTYGVTQTHPLSEIYTVFLNSTEVPGNEAMYPFNGGVQTSVAPGNSISDLFPSSSLWTYQQIGYRAFYDSALTCPLYIQGISESPSNPNIGRPDQHQCLNPLFSLLSNFTDCQYGNLPYGENYGPFTAVAWYWFPYTTVQFIIGSIPSFLENNVNVACLDNTYDPMFIKQSKSTDAEEQWMVHYYYSAILLAPSIYKASITFLEIDDTTVFQQTISGSGYVVNAQEGLAPYDIGGGNPTSLSSGPALYSDSVPNIVSHNTVTSPGFGPDPSDCITRVKVSISSPLNWHKINKYDTQE